MSYRMTIAFNESSAKALQWILDRTPLQSVGEMVRFALTVLSDLLRAEAKGYKIILRNEAGEEFLYSPYRPLRAWPIDKHAKPGRNIIDEANPVWLGEPDELPSSQPGNVGLLKRWLGRKPATEARVTKASEQKRNDERGKAKNKGLASISL